MTTVFKKRWAWYFRKRDGESVLDTSHLREYTDVDVVRGLVSEAGFRIVALEALLWFPLLDPPFPSRRLGPHGGRSSAAPALERS